MDNAAAYKSGRGLYCVVQDMVNIHPTIVSRQYNMESLSTRIHTHEPDMLTYYMGCAR